MVKGVSASLRSQTHLSSDSRQGQPKQHLCPEKECL